MDYFYSITDSQGNIHSIDMLYLEWYSRVTIDTVKEKIKQIHLKYPMVRYEEYFDRKPSSRFDYYRDSICFGICYLSLGRYAMIDNQHKIYHTFNCVKLRFNPNKVYQEDYFKEMIEYLIEKGCATHICKYDYAIDIPLEPKAVKIFSSRKEFGLYKGTRYYGQAGRHNYTKIYDKQKELHKNGIVCDSPVTRLEYTFKGGEIPSFENVYILDSNLVSDFSALNDTEIAIVEMYNTLLTFGFDYELKLGRKMREKLSKYLHGSYRLLEYGDILNWLMDYVIKTFKVEEISDERFFEKVKEKDGMEFIPISEDEELPFD